MYWDHIVSIEPMGRKETYDLEVEGNHNFLANDFVVHNSHAASFALIAYATSWMRKHYLAEFTCSLLNAQPMGFYSPATIVGDAQRHGLEIRPIDVTRSEWDCTLEPVDDGFGFAVRMGLRWVKGMQLADGERIVEARGSCARSSSLEDFVRRTQVPARTHTALAEAGALGELTPARGAARCAVAGHGLDRARAGRARSSSAATSTARPRSRGCPRSTRSSGTIATSDHSTRGHPLAPLRDELRAQGWPDARAIARGRDGSRVDYVGIVICRQQPGTAAGVVFMTLEDETGFVNLVVWKQVFAEYAHVIKTTSLLGVTGRLQVSGGHRPPDRRAGMGPRAVAPGRRGRESRLSLIGARAPNRHRRVTARRSGCDGAVTRTPKCRQLPGSRQVLLPSGHAVRAVPTTRVRRVRPIKPRSRGPGGATCSV